MRLLRSGLVLALLVVAAGSAQAQDPTRSLESALRAAAAGAIVQQADQALDLMVLGSGGVLSPTQASIVLSDFFAQYPPQRSRLTPGVRSGSLQTATGRYWSARLDRPVSVFARYRQSASGWVLVALRVEAGNPRW